ncbi:22961_t:CDS:2, partial [Gigaspora margarita]
MSYKIKVRQLKDVVLSNENYEKYRNLHFTILPLSLLIEKNVSFSNQREEVHIVLRNIKNNENYSDDFFVAARRYINTEEKLSASSSMDSQTSASTPQSSLAESGNISDAEQLDNRLTIQSNCTHEGQNQTQATKAIKPNCTHEGQIRTKQIQTTNVFPRNNDQKYKKLKKILTTVISLSILALFWYHQKTNNTIISTLIETINDLIFEKYNLWKNAKFFKTENNALKVENYVLKSELSNLKTKYT